MPVTNPHTRTGFALQGSTSPRRYVIKQSDGHRYRVGDCVVSAGAADANGVIAVTLNSGTQVPRGVITDCSDSNPTSGTVNSVNGQSRPTIPAIKTRDYYVWVDDNPAIRFLMRDDGAVPGNIIGSKISPSACDFSNNESDAGDFSTATLATASFGQGQTIQILELVDRPELYGVNQFGPYALWLCGFALHELAGNRQTGGGGGGGGSPTQTLDLAADHVVAASDDNVIYYVKANVVVSWNSGLFPKPNVGFVCEGGFSATMRWTGATHDGGLTSDVLKNRSTDPAGFNILPATNPTDATSNDYVVASGLVSFASLTGAATDNTSLVGLFVQPNNVPETMQKRLRVACNASLALDPSQCVRGGSYPPGCVFSNTSGTDVVVTIPATITFPWWAEFRNDASAGSISVANGAGVSFLQRKVSGSNANAIRGQGWDGTLRAYDVPDKYEFVGSDWVV